VQCQAGLFVSDCWICLGLHMSAVFSDNSCSLGWICSCMSSLYISCCRSHYLFTEWMFSCFQLFDTVDLASGSLCLLNLGLAMASICAQDRVAWQQLVTMATSMTSSWKKEEGRHHACVRNSAPLVLKQFLFNKHSMEGKVTTLFCHRLSSMVTAYLATGCQLGSASLRQCIVRQLRM